MKKDNINKLRDHLQGIRKEREQEKSKFKDNELEEIEKLPQKVIINLYCSRCDYDFNGKAEKSIVSLYGIAKYNGECPKCKSRCIRRITEEKCDEYFIKSKIMRIERKKHEIDMLQPGDPRFRTYYKDPYEQYYKKLEEEEKRNYYLNKI